MSDLHVILITMGTMGDAVPFTVLARELKRRGHPVTFMTSADHQSLADSAGVDFVSVLDEGDRPQIGRDERAFFREQMIPAYYNIEKAVRAKIEEGKRIFCVNRFGNWGALFTCERHNLPFVNILLQPASIWEQGQPCCPEDLVLLNRFREDIGLEAIHVEAVLEPALASISMYPEWFGYPKTLSPKAGRCFGFPYLDDPRASLPADVKQFIAEHGKPVVFTAGTGVQEISRFFDVARGLHLETGRPVLFVSMFADGLTEAALPGFQIHKYLDHASLFPEAALVVHNGGIGAIAQTMRAGVPQVVVPLVWDQPDNAQRIEDLGIGVSVTLDELTVERMKSICEQVDTMDRKKVMLVSAAIKSDNAVPRAMDYAEEIMRDWLEETADSAMLREPQYGQ